MGYCDLHLHSALSPCGDNDMTPNNIVNMAVLKGLDVIALTDHNSSRNCEAALAVAKELPITVIPGMELTTSEEIHCVCLFRSLKDALRFDSYVYDRLPDIPNDPAIFGSQWILNESDQVVGELDKLLINATSISVEELNSLIPQYNGMWYPAHIDRGSFSLVSNLGFIPQELELKLVEVHDLTKVSLLKEKAGLTNQTIVSSSDAHYLWDIAEPVFEMPQDIARFLWHSV